MPSTERSECEDVSDADLMFINEDAEEQAPRAASSAFAWRILIVDDDREVHVATKFALSRSIIAGRALEFLSAYSAEEGKRVLENNPGVSVVLLDVVMEEHDSGLKFVEWMRSRSFDKQRIILRTGQPGYAPEADVISNYDINDYRSKAELTQTRLITSITTAVRAFQQLCMIEEQKFRLEHFSYALAHDFKQTTRQMLTFSTMLLQAAGSSLSPAEQGSLLYLKSAARRLGSLVDVLSQYTLLHQDVETQVFDVSSLFPDITASTSQMLEGREGSVSVTGEGKCLAHPALVGHVLQILVANGLQHNEAAKPAVNVAVTTEAGQCVIVVTDNGVGIDPAYREKIFEPRMRLRQSGELPGTGLGLTLSRKAIEAMGGTLECQATSETGSAFRLCLPAPPANARHYVM